jgi:hypothetical protein
MTASTTLKTPDGSGERSPWRPPTRRVFFAMLGAAAAALAVRDPNVLPAKDGAERDRPRRSSTRKTRWVGHC